MTEEARKLTNKQRLFIDYYLQSFNASEAARKAGYSERTAHAMGWENLRKDEIKSAIDEGVKEKRLSISKDWIRVASKKSNYLYLIRAENGLVKIGISCDVEKRLVSLNTASPVELRLLFFLEPTDARKTERNLHVRFAKKRVKGEWFNLSDGDISWIRNNYDII